MAPLSLLVPPLREPGVIKGGRATPGRGPQLSHLVSIQVPWPGPAVGGLMARPMKRVTHQRAQPHAHKTHKSHYRATGYYILFYLNRGMAVGLKGFRQRGAEGQKGLVRTQTIQDLG